MRKYIPGSKWVYFKIYTSERYSKTLLKKDIRLFIKNLNGKGAIDRFFFIRYSDPEYHIRLRFRLKDLGSYPFVFLEFQKRFEPLLNNGAIWDIQSHTYDRELERYGMKTIDIVEEIFQADSYSMFEIIKLELNDITLIEMGIMIVLQYLALFKLSKEETDKFINALASSYQAEFKIKDNKASKVVNDKYRKYRSNVDRILSGNINEPYDAILRSRECALSNCVLKLITTSKEISSGVNIHELIGSIIHMSLNRLFPIASRLQEALIYYFINKSIQSQNARRKIIK